MVHRTPLQRVHPNSFESMASFVEQLDTLATNLCSFKGSELNAAAPAHSQNNSNNNNSNNRRLLFIYSRTLVCGFDLCV